MMKSSPPRPLAASRRTRSDTPMRGLPAALAMLATIATLGLAACGGGADAPPAQADADTAAATLRTASAAGPLAGPTPGTAPGTAATTEAATLASVGERLFNEVRISASGRQACASCHVAAQGHADAAGGFLPIGGVALDRQGLRSSPSLNYLDQAGPFGFNAQGQPRGGLFWDGRADSRAAQARGPLFNANEMANADEAELARRLRTLPYLGELLRAVGLPTAAGDAQLVQASTQALAAYQAQDADFHAFTSKFDAVQAGRASFNAAEARGLAIFNDPARGNCAACHNSAPARGAERALFTNFRYFALGVPRNNSQASADPGFFDLGLCGPNRSDLTDRSELCGSFRVPTLRNVALTAPYFHNGVFQTLEEVVGFYATRESDPARWYPVVGGQVQRYNDLPAAYQANVHRGPPFNRRPNQAPAMSAADVADVVAFLRTLSDGFVPDR